MMFFGRELLSWYVICNDVRKSAVSELFSNVTILQFLLVCGLVRIRYVCSVMRYQLRQSVFMNIICHLKLMSVLLPRCSYANAV